MKAQLKGYFLGLEEGESFQKPSYYRSNRAGSKYSRAALPELRRRRALVLWGWGLTGLLLYMQRWAERTARCRTDVKREFQDKHHREKPRLPLWKISLNTRGEPTRPTLEKASQNQQEESHLYQEHNISLLKKILIIIITTLTWQIRIANNHFITLFCLWIAGILAGEVHLTHFGTQRVDLFLLGQLIKWPSQVLPDRNSSPAHQE